MLSFEMPYLSLGVSCCCRTKRPPAINANQPWRFVQLFCGIMINVPLKSLLVFLNMYAWRIFRNKMDSFLVSIPKPEHENLTQGYKDLVHGIIFFPYPRNFPHLTGPRSLSTVHSSLNIRVKIQTTNITCCFVWLWNLVCRPEIVRRCFGSWVLKRIGYFDLRESKAQEDTEVTWYRSS